MSLSYGYRMRNYEFEYETTLLLTSITKKMAANIAPKRER